jgi:hypothetical protein
VAGLVGVLVGALVAGIVAMHHVAIAGAAHHQTQQTAVADMASTGRSCLLPTRTHQPCRDGGDARHTAHACRFIMPAATVCGPVDAPAAWFSRVEGESSAPVAAIVAPTGRAPPWTLLTLAQLSVLRL